MATTENRLQVTIIGLGLIGASAGLALKRYPDRVVVVGNDRSRDALNQAKNMGVVDRTEWNLINAVRNADRILLAVPAAEVRETLSYIKEDIKQGSLIMDTASVKLPVLAWARELLPENAGLVGGHPIVVSETQDASAARADLFQDKIFCLTADARTPASALQMATDLVDALGARPFFIDPLEHDGLAAAVDHLPMIVAGALARSASESSSWQEMRKLAANQFYTSSYIVEPDAAAAAETCLANRSNVIRWVDNLVAELEQWRQRLEANDLEGLTQAFTDSMLATDDWLGAQASGQWEESAPVEMPSAGSQLRRMFGFGGRDFRNAPKGKGR